MRDRDLFPARDFPVDKTCRNPGCGRTFQFIPADEPNRRYCSDECLSGARRKRQRVAKSRLGKCHECGIRSYCRYDEYGPIANDGEVLGRQDAYTADYRKAAQRKFCSASCAASWWIKQDRPVTPDDACREILDLIKGISGA